MNAPAATLPVLDVHSAQRFAEQALANIVREYPNQPQHVWQSGDDDAAPAVLHPAFYGSYDWHSAVHMHWLLARVRRLFPDLPTNHAIAAVFDAHFSPAAIAAECAYLERAGSGTFERTYGWAWLLKLTDELLSGEDAHAARWAATLAPLAELIVARYVEYLPRAGYAIRHGMHANSAFALTLALDYALRAPRPLFETQLATQARTWFAGDRAAPARWEPSGADFLSPALMEAELMRRVLPPTDYASWLEAFLPRFGDGEPPSLFAPVAVRDRSDPQIVHLDGLNLSRAWCLRGILASLDPAGPVAAVTRSAVAAHLRAGLAGLADADYCGAHWLATFAVLALTEGVDT